MRTQVVLGPQPGTVLDQGTHRVVVKVAYQPDSDNNITDRSLAPRHHAYCRYTLQVMPSPLAAGKKRNTRNAHKFCFVFWEIFDCVMPAMFDPKRVSRV